MNGAINKLERITQNRVVALFKNQLKYLYLGNLEDKQDNSNIETGLLRQYLAEQGYSTEQINKALDRLQTAAGNHAQDLYHKNKDVYQLLRYGVPVKVEAGVPTDTVALINWQHPEKNDFYIAEEVTVFGEKEKRPDIVLYINGIADALDTLSGCIKGNQEAVAETIENNVRKKIIKDQLLDPTYFAKMSKLLDEIIKFRKENAEKYEAYLKKIADLASKLTLERQKDRPKSLNTGAKQALYNNLKQNEPLALQIDAAVLVSKSDGWRGHQAKENQIKDAIWKIVNDKDEVERIFAIVTQQNEY